MIYTHVNTNWALHAEAIDDEPLSQSTIQQSDKLFLLKKKKIKPDKKGEKNI